MGKKKKNGINLNSNTQGRFPNNSRSITESVFSFVRSEKYVLLASLSGIFFFCLMLYATVQLSHSLQAQKQVIGEKEKVMEDIRFWKNVTIERPDYRDGYFMLAIFQYRVGKKENAEKNVDKALELDPNFTEGREFKSLLESKSN